MGLFKSLLGGITKEAGKSGAERFRSMARDPRLSPRQREELLDKADKADAMRIRGEALGIPEEHREEYIQRETYRANEKSRMLRQQLRSRYDDD